MAVLRFTILGCGSSGGVPRIGGLWGACDPANPRNRRRRCSMLVERITDAGTTRVLIDTSPDLREQLLDAGVAQVDAVIWTHAHADHIHGIDDIRVIAYNSKGRVPGYADAATSERLVQAFGYVFETPPGSSYPPILDLHEIRGDVTIDGAGGRITFTPFRVEHGRIDSLGFRIGDLAYLPDVNGIPDETWPVLENLEVWVLDALRRDPHPTHVHLAGALDWIERAAPRRAVLTNMHNDLDYDTVAAETPAHITPAFDGMVIELPA